MLAILEKKSIKNGYMTEKILKKKIEKNLPEIKRLYLDEIKKHIKNAEKISKSDVIPSNQYKTLLQNAPTHIINKMLEEIDISI